MQQKKRGYIIMNLGSPDSTEVKDVRTYLNQFLMDERVIDKPYLLRAALVKGIITPFRAPKSAEAYRTIWTNNGSPLVYITRQQQQALQKLVAEPIAIAMRYGNPDMKSAFDKLSAYAGIEEVVLLPLYPHYAMSSYETAVVHAEELYKKGRYKFSIKFVPPFYNHPSFISALTDSIRPFLKKDTHLLFSYHSIPEGHILKSDPTHGHCLRQTGCCSADSPAHKTCYRHQCFVTTKLVAEALGLPESSYSVSFQSKLGRAEWLKPSTTARMEQMPAEGIKDLAVVCPAFVSDCLETLEEISIRENENFMKAGGKSYTFIPCMNTQPTWVAAMKDLLEGTQS